MKFRRNAPMRIGNVRETDYFVTDVDPPTDFLDSCHEHAVKVTAATGGLERK